MDNALDAGDAALSLTSTTTFTLFAVPHSADLIFGHLKSSLLSANIHTRCLLNGIEGGNRHAISCCNSTPITLDSHPAITAASARVGKIPSCVILGGGFILQRNPNLLKFGHDCTLFQLACN